MKEIVDKSTVQQMKTYPPCCECQTTQKEVRPYGHNGANICFKCAFSVTNKARTEQMFLAQLNAAGNVAILTNQGPVPYNRSTLN